MTEAIAAHRRIVIACGGTGGHFYPGYVLAGALRARGWETLFLLRTEDPAAAVLSAEDLPFLEADLRGMPRGPSREWVRFPLRVAKSLWLARNALRAYQPRCVVGMGGYLTFPAVLAARWLGIPSLIHESNSVLGLANRACLPFASEVALGLPPAGENARKDARFHLTGTPVRPSLLRLPDAAEARRSLGLNSAKTTVLLFGGSQGARGINRLAPEALREAAAKGSDLQCLHLSGPNEEQTVRNAYVGAPFKAVVRGFLNEMERAYAATDLVVCRAGASTLAELYAVRKPALLIPYPSAAAGHQEANARILERAGAAICLVEAGLTPSALAGALADLISSGTGPGSRLERMAQAYGALRLPAPGDAVTALVRAAERLAGA